ncbi:unnamed protein product [Cochlearia groenlandica]
MFQISGYTFKAMGLKMKIMTTVIFTSLLILSVIFLSNNFNNPLLDATIRESKKSGTQGDKLIGGLLTADFKEGSCVSRYYQSLLHRKPSPYKPSEYLISKLRSYEKLHKRCGPGTKGYKKATKNLGVDDASKSVGGCQYVVWVPNYGLGNRIISLVSTFLYGLLTERVTLVDQRKGISNFFCEPFPGTSWLLPRDFPLMNQMLKNRVINSTTIPSHLYRYLNGDYSDQDKMFFCEDDQALIRKVPWLFVKSNLYFVPSLWMIPTFQDELMKLFPQKDTVFHHLSRYLFHPTNQVWSMVTSSYNAYLSKADEILGLQIRVFDTGAGYLQHVMDQILSCTQRDKLLPELATQEEEPQATNTSSNTSTSKKLKVVLVTSLRPVYSEHLKKMFKERPTSNGETIQVYQPSGEMHQQTGKKLHEQKALAEMYLLSLSDNIVTSARSTFGYVAHSLGGLTPWILYKPTRRTAPEPPCVRAISMEPCFHKAPLYGCQAQIIKNASFVMRCEDWDTGLKLT